MTQGKTTLIQKDPQKGTFLSNYRPIKFLPMKILTTKIKEEIYYRLMFNRLFTECRKGTRGTGNLVYIDRYILKESKAEP